MEYLKRTFSVALVGENYSSGWEKTFLPVRLEKLTNKEWVTVSRHKTEDDALGAIDDDPLLFRVTTE